MVDKIQFEGAKKSPEIDQKQLKSAVEDKSVIQEVDQVIAEAVERAATDLHFEPQAEGLTIRVRVKDSLYLVKEIPDRLKSHVVNRIKVVSGMDITKIRQPQSGFFRMTLGEKKIELYAYTMPSVYGEVLTVKVSYKQSATLHLDQLGMNPALLTAYRKALSRSLGLYLLTGPPGSGKRTTIYASILELNKPDKLVMGFDPQVKYEIPGMIQSKTEDRNDFSFAEGIAALLKNEPDIAYIGEISNTDEARVTIQGAFAKRVVFARMTANDTVSAIQNIVDMGVPPFLISASMAAVLNQRLLRRLCPACREPYPADEALQKEIGLRLPQDARFYKARGCSACDNKGFQGQVAIFELYLPSEELNKMVVAQEPVAALRQQAMKEGLGTLKRDGVLKALGGYCTLEEVLNAI